MFAKLGDNPKQIFFLPNTAPISEIYKTSKLSDDISLQSALLAKTVLKSNYLNLY